nr:T9SS type A sorting domain-containing protein [uncultured Psychroserpens sp.]
MKTKHFILLMLGTFLTLNVKSQEYIVGSYWTGSEEVLTSMDLSTGSFSDIGTLTGVLNLNFGQSSINTNNGNWIRITNLGIIIVDTQNAAILNTFPNTLNIKHVAYDPNTNKLFGSYWNGSSEVLTSMDITTGVFTDIGTLTGATSFPFGQKATIDSSNGYLIINSIQLGIMIVDIQDASIVNSFPNTPNMKEFVYDSVTNSLIGEYYTGSEYVLTSMNMSTGVFTDIGTLVGIAAVYSGTNAIDSDNGKYILSTDLGVSIIDISDASYTSYANPSNIKGFEYLNTNTLGLTEPEVSTKYLSAFPNPSSNYLQISGLTKTEKYKLYDSQGRKVNDGIILDDEKIDIMNLTKGLYLLQFDNGNTIKFIKE